MSTRRVPTALHRELSEYASLLRALRTRDALDVTKHLTRSEISLSDDAQTGKPRDHWTRWPLMSNDVLEPEWTLEDEVAVIASHVLRTLPPRPASPTPSEEPEDDIVVLDMQPEDDDPDHAHYIPSLTCIISNYLSIILSQLASLTPPRPASMQNRVEPLNWRAVIDAVVSLRDPQISNPMYASHSQSCSTGIEFTAFQGIAKRSKTFGRHIWTITRLWRIDESSGFV